jgi:acetamidase/formamidase
MSYKAVKLTGRRADTDIVLTEEIANAVTCLKKKPACTTSHLYLFCSLERNYLDAIDWCPR